MWGSKRVFFITPPFLRSLDICLIYGGERKACVFHRSFFTRLLRSTNFMKIFFMQGLDICQNINRSGYLTILLLYDIFNIGIYIKLGQYFPKMLKLQLGHYYPNRGSINLSIKFVENGYVYVTCYMLYLLC